LPSVLSPLPPRPRVDDHHLLRVASRLTDRDRVLIRLLHEHRVFTSAQVHDIGFDSYRRAQERMEVLYALRVVDRFRPHSGSRSMPFHWVLDEAGAAVIAAELGVEVKSLPWRRERSLALATSLSLRHRVGTNGFFTALLRESRAHPGRRLATWWSAWRCAAEWGRIARPDGYGVWLEAALRLPFLLEYDCGTEPGVRLAEKLPGYRDLAQVAANPTWLLFRFPTPRREAEARRALVGGPVLVATAALPPDGNPVDSVWLPLGSSRRLRLAELAALATEETSLL
jgi:hypothetical protein